MHGDDSPRPGANARTDVRDFEAHRGLLFSIAYRMLGSATDAEDVVQDAWLRRPNRSDPCARTSARSSPASASIA
jgi:DNA-directed RNA polymerase specialized sigma24 family protein